LTLKTARYGSTGNFCKVKCFERAPGRCQQKGAYDVNHKVGALSDQLERSIFIISHNREVG